MKAIARVIARHRSHRPGTRTCRRSDIWRPRRACVAACSRRSPDGRPQERRRRDLENLLPLALQAAFALPQMRHRAGAVADDLHLDMARREETAARHRHRRCRTIAALRSGSAPSSLQAGPDRSPRACRGRRRRRSPSPSPPHLARASAMKARACSSVVGPEVPGVIGTSWRAANARACALSPNSASVSGRGPTKIRPASRAQRRERGVLAEEAVARDE